MRKKLTKEDYLARLPPEQFDKYDYTETIYIDSITKIKIRCKQCNEFFLQAPTNHSAGKGCKPCSIKAYIHKRSYNTEICKRKFVEKWGDTYNYDKVVYINSKTKLEVVCKVHGSFMITHNNHLFGNGCPQCGVCTRSKKRTMSWNEVYSRLTAEQLQDNDYSEVDYVNTRTKIKILCRKCNKFFYCTPNNHRIGNGCAKCSVEKAANKMRNSWDTCKSEFIKYWGDTYSYDKSVYVDYSTKLEILCSIHGSFWKTPTAHKLGEGCIYCSREVLNHNLMLTWDEVLSKLTDEQLANNDYSKYVYTGSNNKSDVICNKHGVYQISMANHTRKTTKVGCAKCSNSGTSNEERDLANFIRSLNLEIVTGDNTIIKPLQLDIVVPSKRIAIEYNGIYWHSAERGKGRNYHITKTLACEKAGYRLIQIFGDEWLFQREIVESRLKHILGVNTDKRLAARKLKITKLTNKETGPFLIKTHIQGAGPSPVHSYGLVNNEELVACMTFCPERFKDSNNVELLRFSSKYAIQGGFSKLLKAFIKDTNFTGSIVSFSDKRWSTGGVYKTNGFKLEYTTPPGYDYTTKEGKRVNRQKYQKHKLADKLPIFDPALTEVENCRNNGMHQIWNCGMDKWVLTV